MKITKDNYQTWKDLYKTAIAFRNKQPWLWMTDADLFGVKDPETGIVGYCCIMGNAKQVFALGVYLGIEGFESYWNVVEADDFNELDQLSSCLDQKMLKVEFVDREAIDKVDRAAFKALDLKFRGKAQWVQIRELQPGYLPWYLNDNQAKFLTHVLWQAMEVAEKYQQNDNLVLMDETEEEILVRVPHKEKDGLHWKDSYEDFPPSPPFEIKKANIFLINDVLKSLKKEKAAICFTYLYLPGGVQEGKSRPYFAKLGLWINYGSGFIIGFELIKPDDPQEKLDAAFIQQFKTIGFIPEQILVNTEMSEIAALPVAAALDLEVIHAPEVEEFEEALSFIQGQL